MPDQKPFPAGKPQSVLDRRDFLRFAASGAALLAAGVPAWAAGEASREACPGGDPASYTAARAGMFLLFSDVHFDPFADPGLVKSLAAAQASEWRGILAGSRRAYSPYGRDSNDALFQSFLDDMARRAPKPDFLLFPGDLLCHGFWTLYPKLTGDSSPSGLLAFITKTAAYFLSEVTRRFPGVPLYLALGNNDSFEGDYRIAPGSPYLSATAPLIAEIALPGDISRAGFLDTYPRYGCCSLPLPGNGNVRLVVYNDIFWSKKNPAREAGGPVLEFLDRELASAAASGQRAWLMGHIPPGDNSMYSAAKYLKTGKDIQKGLLADSWSKALAGLLVKHSSVVAASFCGHVHRDEFRLVYPASGEMPAAAMRLGPSISPVTGNNPGYQVYSYDRDSFELLDMTTHYLDLGAAGASWDVEYVYSKVYGRGLRSPSDWREMYGDLRSCPARREAFSRSFDLRSRHVDEVNARTFPIFWDALAVRA